MKHTPGPWINGWGNGVTGPTCPNVFGPTVKADWPYTIVSKDLETIAIIPQQLDGVREANARLISAAPAMLGALISLHKEFSYDVSKQFTSHALAVLIESATGQPIEELIK